MYIDRDFSHAEVHGAYSQMSPGEAVLAALLGVLFLLVFWGLLNTWRVLFEWLVVSVSKRWLPLIVVLLLFGVGSVLYLIKRKWRFHYGMLEIAFALVSGWKWFTDYETGGVLDVFAAVAVVYLIVRGLDNCFEAGRASREIETAATKPRVAA